MVLRKLPAQVVAAGVPAKIIGVTTEGRPSETVDQNLEHVRYHNKASNGDSGNANADRNGQGLKGAGSAKSLGDRRVDSGMGGNGTRKDGYSAARRRGVGVQGIEERKRSFL